MTSDSTPPSPVQTVGSPSAAAAYLSKHRIEALTDGIFAVAMTLLVIELKVGEHGEITTSAQLQYALVALLPKALAWIISFLVLAFFWVGHHRLFQHVRHVNGQMLWSNIVMLGAASLIPFSSALVGQYSGGFVSQCFYAGNLAGLSISALWMLVTARKTPSLMNAPLATSIYVASRFRLGSLIALCMAAVIIAWFAPPFATIVFASMPVMRIVSRRLAAKAEAAERLAVDASRVDTH